MKFTKTELLVCLLLGSACGLVGGYAWAAHGYWNGAQLEAAEGVTVGYSQETVDGIAAYYEERIDYLEAERSGTLPNPVAFLREQEGAQ